MSVKLPQGYKPSADEPFMNEKQREYFRRKLVAWRDELLEDYQETRTTLSGADRQAADFVDQANDEIDRTLELRTRDRERKLIAKIDEALERLKDGTYGYCADTGKPIGLARLEARPTASLSIEAQEAHERREQMNIRGMTG
ncbi:RNA polymerase-binding protein DksA [bacterium]|nr:RNA polymerase-binding protein DksA [bacterium]